MTIIDRNKTSHHALLRKREFSASRTAPVSCPMCGRRVDRRMRKQRFCSQRCRQKAHYADNVRTGVFSGTLGRDAALPTRPPKKACDVNALQEARPGSSLPLNLLGGYRWPAATTVNLVVVRAIIRAEIGETFFDASTVACLVKAVR